MAETSLYKPFPFFRDSIENKQMDIVCPYDVGYECPCSDGIIRGSSALVSTYTVDNTDYYVWDTVYSMECLVIPNPNRFTNTRLFDYSVPPSDPPIHFLAAAQLPESLFSYATDLWAMHSIEADGIEETYLYLGYHFCTSGTRIAYPGQDRHMRWRQRMGLDAVCDPCFPMNTLRLEEAVLLFKTELTESTIRVTAHDYRVSMRCGDMHIWKVSR